MQNIVALQIIALAHPKMWQSALILAIINLIKGLTPEEQNTLLFFNRLNIFLHILQHLLVNEFLHALNIGTLNDFKEYYWALCLHNMNHKSQALHHQNKHIIDRGF